MAGNNVNNEINFGYNKTDNLPQITYLTNNRGSNDIVCMNYVYMLKERIKNSWNYYCRVKGCGASISLKVGILESGALGAIIPFVITYLKINHKGHEVKYTKFTI